MRIITESISIDELKELAKKMFYNMVKAVVDIEKGIMAIDAQLHVDLEQLLLENSSKQENLWGINFHPDETGPAFVEFDSMINVRPNQGNMGRGVEDIKIQEKIRAVADKLVKR